MREEDEEDLSGLREDIGNLEETEYSKLFDKKVELERDIEDLRRYQARLGNPEKNHADNDIWNKFEESIVSKNFELERVLSEIKKLDEKSDSAVA